MRLLERQHRSLLDVLALLANCSAPDSLSRSELVARLEKVLERFVPTDADEEHRVVQELQESTGDLVAYIAPENRHPLLLEDTPAQLRSVTVQPQSEFFRQLQTGQGATTETAHSSETVAGAVLLRWLPVLAKAHGRSEDELLAKGFGPHFFDPQGVRVQFEDGSEMRFRWAAAMRSPDDSTRVAIFTEHSGHHELELGPGDEISGPGLRAGVPK